MLLNRARAERLMAEQGLDALFCRNPANATLPAPFFDQLRAALPGCTWVPATDLINRIRAVKTPEEIACLKRAAEITVKAHESFRQALQRGEAPGREQGQQKATQGETVPHEKMRRVGAEVAQQERDGQVPRGGRDDRGHAQRQQAAPA